MNLQVEEEHFEAQDGSEIFFQTWPKISPKAMIVIAHGLGEYSDGYRLLAEGLSETPYQLVAADLRGHGRSSGKRGVGTIEEYAADTVLFRQNVKERWPDLPFFWLGHSMGGLVLSRMLIDHGPQGALGAVFSSPLMGVALEVPAIKKKSANFLARTVPNLTLYNEIPLNKLTHYEKVVQHYERDHLRHDRISPRLFISITSSMDHVFANIEKIQLPVLVQQSGDDHIVSQPRGEEFYNKLTAPDKTHIVYDGYYHEIYNEIWREKPYKDLVRWLDQHMPGEK